MSFRSNPGVRETRCTGIPSSRICSPIAPTCPSIHTISCSTSCPRLPRTSCLITCSVPPIPMLNVTWRTFGWGALCLGEPIKAALLPLGLSGNSATRVQRPVKTKAPGLRGPCRTDVAPTGGGFQRDQTNSTAHCPVPEAAIQPFPVARTVTTGPGAQKIPFSFCTAHPEAACLRTLFSVCASCLYHEVLIVTEYWLRTRPRGNPVTALLFPGSLPCSSGRPSPEYPPAGRF